MGHRITRVLGGMIALKVSYGSSVQVPGVEGKTHYLFIGKEGILGKEPKYNIFGFCVMVE